MEYFEKAWKRTFVFFWDLLIMYLLFTYLFVQLLINIIFSFIYYFMHLFNCCNGIFILNKHEEPFIVYSFIHIYFEFIKRQ